MRNPFRHCTRSLFIRLAVVMVAAALALNILTYHLFFSFQNLRETTFNRNLVQYARFLARELGTPPDRERAQKLGNELMMRIAVSGQDSWTAGLTNETFPEDHLHTWFSNGTLEASSLHGYHRLRFHSRSGEIITFDIFPTTSERERLHLFGLFFLALTGVLLLLVYGLIRHLLRPVRWLTEGAAAVRDGNLSHRVPERQGGELRELSHTFNQMVGRLESVMESQRRLLLDVSHELRTPLTRLKLRLEMLQGHDKAEAMREDLREMEDMITVLLDAARMRHEALNRVPVDVDLGVLAREIAESHADRTPGIQVQPLRRPVHAWADPTHLRMALNSLLDNALKYSGHTDIPVEIDIRQHDGKAIITVRDYGIGIPEDALPHIFEPFFRVDESRTRETGGYGLGLNLCKAITDAHGGSLEITSSPGEGTLVKLILPIVEEQS